MIEEDQIKKIQSELSKGMKLAKCRKCGCMKGTLENMKISLAPLQTKGTSELLGDIKLWLNNIESIEYSCLGCKYCFPAIAMNIFTQAFPDASEARLNSAFEIRQRTWPFVPGEYFAFCEGASCPVAVSTLASVELAERLASLKPKGLCIVGKTETENIGIDKVIKNIITNPTIRILLLTGNDPKGHHSGATLLTLCENGVDGNMRVIGSPGRHPVLKNVSKEEIEVFRGQVQIVDMIGCEDEDKIVERIAELGRSQYLCSCVGHTEESAGILNVPIVHAEEPDEKEMDKAGYFVIIPQQGKKFIIVEHYSYDNKLLRVIEGKDARSIYWTIIQNKWVTQLSHAAYLGKELMKAELSIKMGSKYIQDGA